jgi:galacturan 1,4-alpha-galacturonidase
MFLFKKCQFTQLLLFLLLVLLASAATPSKGRRTCTVKTSSNGTDDTPAILAAFKECGNGGNVVFLNETYHVNSVMNTTGLCDCEIDLYGTLLVRTKPNHDRQPPLTEDN